MRVNQAEIDHFLMLPHQFINHLGMNVCLLEGQQKEVSVKRTEELTPWTN